ncbi:MAG TPA: fibronectin type III domain-containing protein [Verrucomicrobiales bacterium]|nr:fibronectin type III domain-containing protein [Verrucomicrobiales bacterium]
MRCRAIFFLFLGLTAAVWPRDVELVSPESDWKYFDLRNPPAGWKDLDYDDFFWKSGRARLGYGLAFQGTLIGHGADEAYRNLAAFFRKRFYVADPEQFRGLRLELVCWDGAVVYLNGTEIARVGMPEGEVTQETYAAGSGGQMMFEGAVEPSLLQAGENVLSVEPHKRTDSWQIFGMDAALWGQPASPEVIDVEIQPDAVYFLLDEPSRVAVYDLPSRGWLPVIPVHNLIGQAKHLTVSEDGVFVASDTRFVHWDAQQGEWESFPTNQDTSFSFLGSWPGHVAIGEGEYLHIRKFPFGSEEPVVRYVSEFRFSGATAQRGEEPEFYEQNNSSAGAWPRRIRLTDDGVTLEHRWNDSVAVDASLFTGLHPSPRGGILISRQGTVFSENRLEVMARLVNPVIHSVFTESNEIVVATNDEIIAYDRRFRETGRKQSMGPLLAMACDGSQVVLFTATGSGNLGMTVETAPLETLGLLGSVPEPVDSPSAVEAAFVSGDTLYLLDSVRNRLNRFSLVGREYLPSFPLKGSPGAIAHVAAQGRAFYTTTSRDLWRIHLASGTSTRVVEGTVDPAALAASGDRVGAWHDPEEGTVEEWDLESRRVLRLYSADGTMLPGEWLGNFPSRPTLTGCPGWLFYPDGGTLAVAVEEGGGLGGWRILPVDLPLAFEEKEGDVLGRGLTSSGEVIAVESGNLLGRLPGFQNDDPFSQKFSRTVSAVWLGEDVIGIWASGEHTRVVGYRVSSSSAVRSILLPGNPLHVLAHGDKVVVVTRYESVPRIQYLDGTLNVLWSEPRLAVAPADLALVGRSADALTLQWDEPTGSAEAFLAEYRSSGGMEWQKWPAELPGSSRQAILQGFPDTGSYVFRMRSRNALGESDPTEELPVLAAGHLGGPYNLRVLNGSSTAVTMAWDDRLTHESGFRLLWKQAEQEMHVAEVPANTQQHRLDGLTPSTEYLFWVEAVTGGVLGDRSETVWATTLSRDDGPPEGELRINDVEVFSDGFWVSWEDSFLNEEGYFVELGPTEESLVEIARLDADEREFRIEGLEPLTPYVLRITAYNGFGAGGTSGAMVWETSAASEGYWNGLLADRNGVLHFGMGFPNRIERFDKQSGLWLEPWRFSGPVLQLWADERGLLATIGSQLIELNANGDQRILYAGNLGGADYFSVGDRIHVGGQAVLDRNSGALLQRNVEGFDPVRGVAVDPGHRQAYGITNWGRVVRLEFDEDGDFQGNLNAPGDYGNWNPDRAYLFPGGQSVAPNSGPVFDVDGLGLEASLGGRFQDMAFVENGILLLRDEELVLLDRDLNEAGRLTLGQEFSRIAVVGETVFCFRPNIRHARAIEVHTASLGHLGLPVPAEPLLGQGIPFVPDVCFSDGSGYVWMGAFALRHFLRWSLTEAAFVEPRPLLRVPISAGYSSDLDRVYVGYRDAITVMEATGTFSGEAPFALPLHPPVQLVAMDFQVLVDTSPLVFLHGHDGSLRDAFSPSIESAALAWSPAAGRVLSMHSTGSGEYHAITDEGLFGDGGLLPPEMAPPMLVEPGGSVVATGSGKTLIPDVSFGYASGPQLVNAFSQGVWVEGELFTLRSSGADRTQIQRWSGANFDLAASREAPGLPNAIVAAEGKVMVVTVIQGAPCVRYVSAETLEDEFVSPRRPAPPGEPRVTQRGSTSVRLAWTDLSDNETGFEVEYRQKLAGDIWMGGTVVGSGVTQGEVSGLLPNTRYVFRVMALGGAFRSDLSGEIETSTLVADDLPGGEPYHLRAVQVFANRVVLQWDDHSHNESGFRILRSQVSPPGAAEDVVGIAGADETLFTDAGLAAGATYDYRVEAFNTSGAGERSAALRVATRVSDVLGEEHRPDGFVYVESGADFVVLRWSDETTHEEGFILERKRKDGGEHEEIARLPFNTTEYRDSGLEPGVVYIYRLAPFNSLGRSEFSPERWAETLRLGGLFNDRVVQRGSILYFAMREPDTLQRYDLSRRGWLAPHETGGSIFGLWADADAVFLVLPSGIWRWGDGDQEPVFLRAAGIPAASIFTVGRNLYFSPDLRNYQAVDKFSGALRELIEVNPHEGLTPVPTDSGHRIAGVLRGDFSLLRFESDGSFLDGQRASGIERTVARCQASENGDFVALNNGLVYRLDPLGVAGSLGSEWEDLDFWGERPVKLQSGRIVVYEDLERGRELARGEAPADVVALAVQGDDALVFEPYAGVESGFVTHEIDLREQRFPVAEGPVIRGDRVESWPFRPFAGQRSLVVDGIVYFLVPGHNALARYALAERVFLESIPLAGNAVGIIAAREEGSVLLWYADGLLTSLELSAARPREAPFASAVRPGLARLEESGMTIHSVLPHPEGGAMRFRYDDEQRLLEMRSPNSSDAPLDAVWSPNGEWYVTPSGDVVSTNDGDVIADLTPGLPEHATIATAISGGSLVSAGSGLGQITEVVLYNEDLQERVKVYLPGVMPAVHALPGGGVVVLTIDVLESGAERFVRIFRRGPELEPLSDSVRGAPPQIVRQPWSRSADVGGEAAFRVEIATGTEASYQWWKGWEKVPGGTSPELTLSELTLDDSGVYRVEATNFDGSVFSRFATLTVGASRSWFTAGNLLAVRSNQLFEVDSEGSVVKSMEIPASQGRALIVNRYNGIHVLQEQHSLASFNPLSEQWRFQQSGGSSGLPTDGFYLALRGDEILGPGTVFRFLEGSSVEFSAYPDTFPESAVFNGADGNIYSVRAGEIIERDASTWETLEEFSIGAGLRTTADAGGNFFTVGGDSSQLIRRWRRAEEEWVSLNPGGYRLTNVSASADGLLAAGADSGHVVLTDTELSIPQIVNLPGTGPSYVVWTPRHEATAIEPTLEAGALEWDAGTGYFRQTLTIMGPARSNFHHFELVVSGLTGSVWIVNFDPRAEGPEIRLPYAGAGVDGPGRTQVQLLFESMDGASPGDLAYALRWLDPNFSLLEPQIAEGPDGRIFATFPTIPGWNYRLERTKDILNWQPATDQLPAPANHRTWELVRGGDLELFRAAGSPP